MFIVILQIVILSKNSFDVKQKVGLLQIIDLETLPLDMHTHEQTTWLLMLTLKLVTKFNKNIQYKNKGLSIPENLTKMLAVGVVCLLLLKGEIVGGKLATPVRRK